MNLYLFLSEQIQNESIPAQAHTQLMLYLFMCKHKQMNVLPLFVQADTE